VTHRRSTTRLLRLDAAQALVTREGASGAEVLLVWNADWRTPCWSLPGGKREAAETLAEAVVRETREETGLLIEVGDLVEVQEIVGLGRRTHIVVFTFQARAIGGTLVADGQGEPVAGEVMAAGWFTVPEARRVMAAGPSGAAALDALTNERGGARYRAERRRPSA
jgi:8-oxo-dGTP diphosphatase